MCYNCQTKSLANKTPCAMTWAIVGAICEALVPIVTTCVVNQCHGYQLLFNALASTIKLYVRLEKEKFDMQAKVDLVTYLDMQMNVKQFEANMK